MKAFWIYTAARLGLFVLAAALCLGLRALVLPMADVPVVAALLLAILVSSVASWWLLVGQRDRLALVVARKADRASSRFEAARAKEDVD